MSEALGRSQAALIVNIQALRAIAALLVVLHHLRTILIGVPGLSQVAEFAGRGVDLFFVISGFIMVFITRRSNPTPLSFLANRFARIVPLYWIFTLVTLAVALVMPSGLKHTDGSLLNLFRSLAFIPYVRADGLIFPMLTVGWSLNLEIIFYLFFALALFLPRTNRSVMQLAFALIATAVAGAFVSEESPILNFYTQPMMAEFGLGMLIGLSYDRLSAPRGPALPLSALVVGVALVIGSGLVADDGLAAWLMGMFGWTLVVAAAIQMERAGLAVRAWPILLIGEASYVLYLSHLFFTRIAEIVVERLFADSPGFSLVCAIGALMAAILFAVFAHRKLEKPVTAWTRAFLHVGKLEQAGAIRGAEQVSQQVSPETGS